MTLDLDTRLNPDLFPTTLPLKDGIVNYICKRNGSEFCVELSVNPTRGPLEISRSLRLVPIHGGTII